MMVEAIFQVHMLYALFGALCMVVGGGLLYFWKPGPKSISSTQHFAAGVVFAAVAIELLPRIIQFKSPGSLTIGFFIGLLTMIFVKMFTEKIESRLADESYRMPWGMVFAVGVDLFIDGILMSIAFAAGERDGLLVAVALGIEILFIGLSAGASMLRKSVPMAKNAAVIVLLALLVPLGFWGGDLIIDLLPKEWLNGTLAFGVSALLYLVVEELLTEAHEVEETPWVTASFFVGFFAILFFDTQL